jgi:hypothetical protein
LFESSSDFAASNKGNKAPATPPQKEIKAEIASRTYALTKLSKGEVSENREIFGRSLIDRGIERRIIPMLS